MSLRTSRLAGVALILGGFGLCGIGVVTAIGDSRKVEIPAVLDVGAVSPGTHSVDLVIDNPTSKPFRVLGARVCCGLESVKPLPMTITPGESGTLNLEFSCRGDSGYEGKVVYKLFVDNTPDLSFNGEVRYQIQ